MGGNNCLAMMPPIHNCCLCFDLLTLFLETVDLQQVATQAQMDKTHYEA